MYDENNKANRKLVLDRAVILRFTKSVKVGINYELYDVGIELKCLVYVYSCSYCLEADIAFNSVNLALTCSNIRMRKCPQSQRSRATHEAPAF